MREQLLTLTSDEIDGMCDRRNASTNKKIAAMQERHDTLAAQIADDKAAIASMAAEEADLLARLSAPDPDYRAEMQHRIAEQQTIAESYQQRIDANKRELAIARAVASSNAISAEQISALVSDVPTDEIASTVEAMRDSPKFANLFAPTIARGVGGTTEPPKGSDPVSAGASGVARMSDAQYFQARASGALDGMFGRK